MTQTHVHCPFHKSPSANDLMMMEQQQQHECDRSTGSRAAFRFLVRRCMNTTTTPSKTNATAAADDRSVTSELTVESCSVVTPKTLPLPLHLHANEIVADTSRKCVRFDLKGNTSYDNQLMFAEDCATLWYSTQEQAGFRNNVTMIVSTLVNADKGVAGLTYSAVIQNVFLACKGIDFEINASVLTRKEERAIRDMFKTKTGQPYIGLERRIVRSISKDKRERRRRICAAIGAAQARFCGLPMDDETAETVRRECEKLSLCSRLFARHLAQAQAASIAAAAVVVNSSE